MLVLLAALASPADGATIYSPHPAWRQAVSC